jgi:protein-S-isoprenylcysteine O-methyltransferase Ste14
MDYLLISRILFVLLLVNEGTVMARSTPAQRAEVIMPRFLPVFFILLLLPFFVGLQLPDWLGLLAVIIQAGGLILEVAAEVQLTRAKSFAITPEAASQPQTTGLYGYLENPIYTAIALQFFAWSLFMPLTFICLFLQIESCRRMVRLEREYLQQTFQFVHRGIDSFLWN